MKDWSKTSSGAPIDRGSHALLLLFGGFLIGGLLTNMIINPTSGLLWPSALLIVLQCVAVYFNLRRVAAP